MKRDEIVWVRAGIAGAVHDITIAKESLVKNLMIGEAPLADRGYQTASGNFVTPVKNARTLEDIHYNTMLEKRRWRIEAVNNLGDTFRNIFFEQYLVTFTNDIVEKLKILENKQNKTEKDWSDLCQNNSLLPTEEYGPWLVFMYCRRFLNKTTRAKPLTIEGSTGIILPTVASDIKQSKNLIPRL